MVVTVILRGTHGVLWCMCMCTFGGAASSRKEVREVDNRLYFHHL